ncbi:mariner Mos1 transposase [Trichonephila clavipes]|nr:mariner Mos1 transposase [Trichonephila clavipes]
MIFLDDNSPSHHANPIKNIVKALGWEPLAHAAYSPVMAPFDYHLFASLGHALADQRFTFYENSNLGLPQKTDHFFGVKIPEGSELANMVVNDAKMVVNDTNLVSKNDANLALPPRFRQVLIESPL